MKNLLLLFALISFNLLSAQCTMTASITSQTNVSCNGGSDGSLIVTQSGGTANFTYNWSNSSSTANTTSVTDTITGLSAGTYFVTITDNAACTAVDSAVVVVVDTINPMLMTSNLSIVLDSSRETVIDVNNVDNGTTDNCAVDSLWVSDSIFNCSQVGVNNVWFYAEDSNGNIDSIQFTVTISDTIGTDTTVIQDTACGSYLWVQNGETYLNSGSYYDTLGNRFGCDSVIFQLDLLIDLLSFSTDVQTACDSLVWIDGNTYSSNNNTATDTLVSANGCDSIITLDLTILNSSGSTQSDSACYSYTWVQNGQTYTNSGTYTDILVNSVGCDSVISLDLEIRELNLSVVNVGDSLFAFQEGATYQWYDCRGDSLINGVTTKGYRPDTSGFYSVIINNGLCFDTSACQEVILTGLKDLQANEAEVTIYPNPTSDQFIVQVNVNQLNQQMLVYDMNGKVVFQQRVDEPKEKINVEGWNKGIYFVRYGEKMMKLVVTD